MDPLLALIGLTLLGTFALGGTYVGQRISAPQREVRRRISSSGGIQLRTASVLRLRRSRFPLLDRLPLAPEARQRMALELEHAGLAVRVSEYLGLRMASAAAVGGVCAIFAASTDAADVIVLAAAVAGLLVGWLIPRAWLGYKRDQRKKRIERQLPEALTAIAKALRAGSGLLQALAYAADETPEPLGPELQSTLRDLQLGADAEVVFGDLARRVGSTDLDIAVTAIVIQRSVGGNLSEILTNVTNTIRERNKLHREIQTLTARQKLMGNLVAGLPVLVALLFIGINPDIGRQLYETDPGRIAMAMAVAFELLGLYLIRRLAIIDV